MARKRFISPEFFAHGELYDAEVRSGLPLRLAFAGLWTQCDRRGLFRWKPRELKLAILPYDPADMSAVLAALEAAGFVRHYVAEGREYGEIASFPRWQTFHIREHPDASIPAPPPRPTPGGDSAEHRASTVPSTAQDSAEHRASTPVTATVTATAAVTATAKKTTPADAALSADPEQRPERASSARRREPKYPHYPTPLCQALHAAYERTLEQVIDYATWRKVTAVAFGASSPLGPPLADVPEAQFREAITIYAMQRNTAPVRERPFFTPARFATDLPRLLRLGREPLQFPDGSLSEKGRLLFTEAAAS